MIIHNNTPALIKFYDTEIYRYHKIFVKDSKMEFDSLIFTGFVVPFEFTEEVGGIDFLLVDEWGNETDLKSYADLGQFIKSADNYPIFKGSAKLSNSLDCGNYSLKITSATNEAFSDYFYIYDTDFAEVAGAVIINYDKELSTIDAIDFSIELKTSVSTLIKIDWGDGNEDTYAVTSTGHEFSNTFTGTGNFTIKITGNLTAVNYFKSINTLSTSETSETGYASQIIYTNMHYMSNVEYLYLDTNSNYFPFYDLKKLSTVEMPSSNYTILLSLDGLEESKKTLTTFKCNEGKFWYLSRLNALDSLRKCKNIEVFDVHRNYISSIYTFPLPRGLNFLLKLTYVNFSYCNFSVMPDFGRGISSWRFLSSYDISNNRLLEMSNDLNYPFFFINGETYDFSNNRINTEGVDLILDSLADYNVDKNSIVVDISGACQSAANAIPTRNVRFLDIFLEGINFVVGDIITMESGNVSLEVTEINETGGVVDLEIIDGGSGYTYLSGNSGGSGTGLGLSAWSSLFELTYNGADVIYNS